MAPKPHYVAAYGALVRSLRRNFTLDEAMSRAVGGDYEGMGRRLRAIVEYAGLKDGMALVDIGCGSGRLSTALSQPAMRIDYLGTDIVKPLLKYAQSRASSAFAFRHHTELSLPVPSASVDMCCAFSVFTHLRHEETFLYLQDGARALRPGGTFVFSFLEFAAPGHWNVFDNAVEGVRHKRPGHLDVFIERNALALFAERLGYQLVEFVDGSAAPWGGEPIGQSTAILRKA